MYIECTYFHTTFWKSTCVKSTKFNTLFEKCGVYSFFKFIENLCTLNVHNWKIVHDECTKFCYPLKIVYIKCTKLYYSLKTMNVGSTHH